MEWWDARILEDKSSYGAVLEGGEAQVRLRGRQRAVSCAGGRHGRRLGTLALTAGY